MKASKLPSKLPSKATVFMLIMVVNQQTWTGYVILQTHQKGGTTIESYIKSKRFLYKKGEEELSELGSVLSCCVGSPGILVLFSEARVEHVASNIQFK